MDLKGLRDQKKWTELMKVFRRNKNEAEGVERNKISDLLDEVLLIDQSGRKEFRAVVTQYGYGTAEAKKAVRKVWLTDSINVIKVTHLLDSMGWPPLKKIGRSGSNAVFLTIQHGDLATQEKYLPVLKKAVKDGKIAPGALALLEDRLGLRQGKRQVYGSQFSRDSKTKILIPYH